MTVAPAGAFWMEKIDTQARICLTGTPWSKLILVRVAGRRGTGRQGDVRLTFVSMGAVEIADAYKFRYGMTMAFGRPNQLNWLTV